MKNKNSLKTVLELFSIFFYVAIFTVGGGIAMVPVLERILVEKKKYLDDKEFREVFSIAQILPGSLMINMATFTGYKIIGFWGSLFSCIAIMIPPLAIITFISIFYAKFIQFAFMKKLMLGILAGVVGEVSGITLKMFKKTKFDAFKIALLVFSFALIFIFKVNPIYVVIIGALLGISLGRMEE
jgi:chromate transporter